MRAVTGQFLLTRIAQTSRVGLVTLGLRRRKSAVLGQQLSKIERIQSFSIPPRVPSLIEAILSATRSLIIKRNKDNVIVN